MAVMVEMQNTGDPGLQREVAATIELALADRPGDYGEHRSEMIRVLLGKLVPR